MRALPMSGFANAGAAPAARARTRKALGGSILVLCGLAAGCGGAADSAGDLGFQRLRLQPVAQAPEAEIGESAAEPAAVLRIAQRLDVPPELEPWVVEQQNARVVPLRDANPDAPQRALELPGGESQKVLIPGPFEPTSFNQIAVTIDTRWDIVLGVALRHGTALLRPEQSNLLVPAARDPQVVVIDLPQTRTIRRPFDHLILAASQAWKPWRVLRVDLIERPIRDFLPGLEPELVALGDEARLGVGLASGQPLFAECSVPRGAELSFSYGWPPTLRTFSGRAELVVSIRGAEAPKGTVLRLPLGTKGAEGPAWRSLRQPLEDWQGQRVRITFAVESAGPDLALCVLAEPAVSVPSAEGLQSVLLVTSDTHRADHVEEAPRAVALRTPALRALAARGVAFDDCIVTANNTIPSHVAIFTATHPRDTGVTANRARLGPDAPTLAESFHAAGFATYALTSMRNLGHVDTGLGQGFDRISWPPTGQRDAAATLAELERWLPDAEGKPLFVWVHLYDAHYPYAPPEPFASQAYPSDKDPKDLSFPEPDFPVPVRNMGVRDPSWFHAMYKGEVEYVDERLAALFAEPRFADGVIALTSDHGESMGQNGIWWDHTGLYPDVLDVPLILAWPAAPAGRRVAAPIDQLDLGRTLLDLAGLEQQPFAGRSLLGWLDEKSRASQPRFALGAQVSCASVSVGRWHLILNLDHSERSQFVHDDEFPRHSVELYDLEADPGCAENLLERDFERAASLRGLLVDWLTGAAITGWGQDGVDDPEMLANLAELGYVVATGPAAGRKLFDATCACEHCAPFAGD